MLHTYKVSPVTGLAEEHNSLSSLLIVFKCVLFYARNCVCLGLSAEELKSYGIQDVFVFCTRGELSKYRVPNLLDLYQQYGIVTHHHPIPDGGTPDIGSCWEIMEELATCLKNNRKTLIQYVLPWVHTSSMPVTMTPPSSAVRTKLMHGKCMTGLGHFLFPHLEGAGRAELGVFRVEAVFLSSLLLLWRVS